MENAQLYGMKEKEKIKYCGKLVASMVLNESFIICSVDIFPDRLKSKAISDQQNWLKQRFVTYEIILILNLTLSTIS